MGNRIRHQHGVVDSTTAANGKATSQTGRTLHQARRKALNMKHILDAALQYAFGNMPVFPVGRSDKHPLCVHGLNDATIDEAQIRAWWRQYPHAMIGIATGPRAGIWVLDVDSDLKKAINGHASMARLEIEHGPLPLTLCS